MRRSVVGIIPDGDPTAHHRILQDAVPPTDTNSSSWKWKNRYQWVEQDVLRTEFHSPAEVESLYWYLKMVA